MLVRFSISGKFRVARLFVRLLRFRRRLRVSKGEVVYFVVFRCVWFFLCWRGIEFVSGMVIWVVGRLNRKFRVW